MLQDFSPLQVENKETFILCGQICDNICDKLIEVYNNKTPDRGKIGTMLEGGGYVNRVDTTVKDSYDVALDPDDVSPYVIDVFELVKQYIRKYDILASKFQNYKINETINIQKYPPDGGFHQPHYERNYEGETQRHFVFMTYLNTIEQGGETHFKYYNGGVQPRKGLTLLWPADWTHTHYSIPAPKEEKMIITGWINYESGN